MSGKERIMHSPNSFAGINKWEIMSTRKRKKLGKIVGTLFVYLMVGLIFSGSTGAVDVASFSIGNTVKITANLNVRTGAGTSYSEITDSDYLGYAPTGTIGKILSGPSSADGYVWWEVDFGPELYSGWSVEDGFKLAFSLETFATEKIYIDSVPRGAHVYAAESEQGQPLKELGITPLVLDSSKLSTRKFWIMMVMDDYAKAIVDGLPQMKDWLDELITYTNNPPASLFFDFFDTNVTQSAYTPEEGTLAATGPILEMIPIQNRICVLFVPKGKDPSILRPLMPPRGTFYLNEDNLERTFVNKYGFKLTQAKNALDLLSRCGRAIVAVPNRPEKNKFAVYSFTCNGPGAELLLIIQEWMWDSAKVKEAGLYSD